MVLTAEQATKQHAAELRDSSTRSARAKLANIIRSYPKDTPDEWIVFGYGGVKISLKDLREAFGVE